MRIHPFLHLFVSSSLVLVLAACGTTTLGGGTGAGGSSGDSGGASTGGPGTGGAGRGSGGGIAAGGGVATGGAGTGGVAAGGGNTGGAATGGAGGAPCTPNPGGPDISAEGFSMACTQDSDCAAVYSGIACTNCACPNTAIASSGLDAYEQQAAAARATCCAPTQVCNCPAVTASCLGGTCMVGVP
jgi:hypothetical protein